jgi:transmembrane sensor
MLSDHEWDRLVRYATGECDPAEARETLRWINADHERARAAEDLASLHRVGGSIPRRWNVDAAWRNVAPPPVGVPAPRRVPTFPTVKRSVPLAARLAAGIAAVLSAGAFWHFMLTARPSLSDAPAVAMQEIAAQRGQLTKLRLGDGSHIVLAAASRIRYARDFGAPGRARDVYLEGRALFDVVHDDQRPFRVHTTHAVAEDIGTRFVVAAYAEDSVDRVAVVEGVVALRDARDTVMLDRGDVGTATPEAGLHVLRNVDLAVDTAWTGSRLVFRRTPLRDVIPELARWYDVEIRLADPALGDRLLTTEDLGLDAPRDAVLANIARALQLRSEQVGSVVVWSRW